MTPTAAKSASRKSRKRFEDLGYTVVATEAQQYKTDEAIFATIRRRGFLAVGLSVADLLFDPLNLFGVPPFYRAVVSGIVAAVVLLWIGYPILRKTLMAVSQRVINANQLLMDKLMNYYGPVVYAVAAVAFVGWLFYTGSVTQAILIGLTTIIMGYPCALGITTPMVLAIGGGHGIARGLLVRAGEFFQELAEVDTVVFDKTGTLTYGRPTVSEVVSFGADEREVLAVVAAAETGSEHPLAGAIVRYAEFQDVSLPEAANFKAVPGKGVTANVNGRRVVVGRRSFLEAEGVRLNGNRPARVEELEAGHTIVYAAVDGKPFGAVALQDMPRPGTHAVMKRLNELGIRTAMLTGDNRSVAESVAKDIGIDEVYAELLPEDKVSVIERMQAENRKVAMVGDGINDAPALVQSDVGIALGAGTDVAMESAGVVLVSDKLDKVVSSILLGRASHRKMKQNIAIAVISNIVGMTLAILGLITAPIAIAVMTASIFTVLLSTLLLMRLHLGSSETEDAENLTETIIPARKIHCEACSRKIVKTLSPVPGVRKVLPDVARKEVLVAFEPSRVSEEQLRGQLAQLGFR